jgi:glutaredoxin-related protein
VVTELKKKYAFDIEVVKKTSFGLLQRASLPKFPAIEIDGTVVFGGCDITTEQLEAAIRQRQSA